jgi:hypothetical protein
MMHDYKRHGTTTSFAALDVATGKVIGQCMTRHRHQQWLKFLRRIDAETPRFLDVQLIADNYATTSIPQSRRGCGGTLASTCISRRLRPLGPTSSSVSSA